MSIKGFPAYEKEHAQLYNKYRWWLGLTWGDVLDKASDLYPRKVGLVDNSGSLTYGKLREKVDRLAIGLVGLGIKKHDFVLLQIPNWHEYVIAFCAKDRGRCRLVASAPYGTRDQPPLYAYKTQGMDTAREVQEARLRADHRKSSPGEPST